MSLVGSLEDLGLGDILQIVSLSRKSGLLMIHSEEGEGRIVFCDGLVRAAFVKGEAVDLRALLVETQFLPETDFERAVELAAARGEPLDAIIPECTELTKERLDSLCREHVERAVFRIFSWQGGEFSFEVRDEVEPRDAEILLSTGINAQYLTMEASRIDDEDARPEFDEPSAEPAPNESVEPVPDGPFFSGEAETPVESVPDEVGDDATPPIESSVVEPEPADVVALAAAQRVADPGDEVGPDDAMAASTEARSETPDAAEVAGPSAPSQRPALRPLIAIDPNLTSVEWQKAHLRDLFQRVHIFQNSEAGIARIRQYLTRGEIPAVLVSCDLSRDSTAGADGIDFFVQRLKQQAPTMPVLVTWEEGGEETLVPLADAMVRRPNPAFIGGKRSQKLLEVAVANLREDVGAWLDCAAAPSGRPVAPKAADAKPGERPDSGLQRLRATSERMRNPELRGEVLSLALGFAAESFSRVAMFMVRDETAVGIAQSGLPLAGGPGDDEFCGFHVPVGEVEWFTRVVEQRKSLAAPPSGDGDRRLTERLGNQTPRESYVGPIESGGCVVALLYADNLPSNAPVTDTTILEIVLHEAGLALERALLERALAQAGHETR